MTKQQDEMWVEVLEWMGWKHFPRFNVSKCPDGSDWIVNRWVDPNGATHDYNFDREKTDCLPPLTLDALHDCEAKLSNDDYHRYKTILAGVVDDDWKLGMSFMSSHDQSATKEQRLLALWRTLQ